MDRFLNIPMLAHPLNWLTVFLMVAIALVFVYIAFPETKNESN